MERLNRFLAAAGFGSRRACDLLVQAHRVAIDGVIATQPGARVSEGQQVTVDRRPVERQKVVYWLVNKPNGYLCTNHDPAGRPRVIDLLAHVPQRIYTVGRLDEDSEGLLLLTNDGELAQRLTHPRFGIEKTYLVQVAGQPEPDMLAKLTKGVWLAEGLAKAKRAKRLRQQGNSTWLEIVLAEGKNREIRRMLAKLGHKVLHLRRVAIGPIKLDRLKPGKCRKLSLPELSLLKRLAAQAGMPRNTKKGRPPTLERGASRELRLWHLAGSPCRADSPGNSPTCVLLSSDGGGVLPGAVSHAPFARADRPAVEQGLRSL